MKLPRGEVMSGVVERWEYLGKRIRVRYRTAENELAAVLLGDERNGGRDVVAGPINWTDLIYLAQVTLAGLRTPGGETASPSLMALAILELSDETKPVHNGAYAVDDGGVVVREARNG